MSNFANTLLSGLKTAGKLAAEGLKQVVASDTVREGTTDLAANAINSLFSTLAATGKPSLTEPITLDSRSPSGYLSSMESVTNLMESSYNSVSEQVSAPLTTRLLSSHPNLTMSIQELGDSTNEVLVNLSKNASAVGPSSTVNMDRYNNISDKLESLGSGIEPDAFTALQGKLDTISNSLTNLTIGSDIAYDDKVFVNSFHPWVLPMDRIEAAHQIELPIGTILVQEANHYTWSRNASLGLDSLVESEDLIMRFDSSSINPCYDVRQTAKLMISEIVATEAFHFVISIDTGSGYQIITDRIIDPTVGNNSVVEYIEFSGSEVPLHFGAYTHLSAGPLAVDAEISILDVGVTAVQKGLACGIEDIEYLDSETGVRKNCRSGDTYFDYLGKLQFDPTADPNFSVQALWANRSSAVNITLLSEILSVVEAHYDFEHDYTLSDKWEKLGVDFDKLIMVPMWLMSNGAFYDESRGRIFRDEQLSDIINLFYADIDVLRDGALFDRKLAHKLVKANSRRC